MTSLPLQKLTGAMRRNGLVRFLEQFAQQFPESHLKDLVVDDIGAHRKISVQGREVVNFGSDSFLGLDRDARVQDALIRGIHRWGSHNGASRAFASVQANVEAEAKL